MVSVRPEVVALQRALRRRRVQRKRDVYSAYRAHLASRSHTRGARAFRRGALSQGWFTQGQT